MSKRLKLPYLERVMCALLMLALFPTGGIAMEIKAGEYDPKKVFQFPQTSLVEIFRQLGTSLEVYGSPLPYIHHVYRQNEKIAAKYRSIMGKDLRSYMPPGMDEKSFKQLSSNRQHMASQLGLDARTKKIGTLLLTALDDPTTVQALTAYQESASVAMKSGGQFPEVEELKSLLESDSSLRTIRDSNLELYKKLDAALPPADATTIKTAIDSFFADTVAMAETELKLTILAAALSSTSEIYSAEQESNLTPAERDLLVKLLAKKHFTKADFGALEKFYSESHDKLTERGKNELSIRVWEGVRKKD